MEKVALPELGILAKRALALLPGDGRTAVLIALQGELGAGKTTFVQALGKELGVTEVMQSPTYVLMKKYSVSHPRFATLMHIDAYRLEKPEEFAALRPREIFADPHALVVVEWPERVAGVLPKPDLTMHFSSEGCGEGERLIELV